MKDRAFIPSVYEIAYLACVSLLLLFGTTLPAVLRQADIEKYTFFQEVIGDFIARNLSLLSSPTWSRIMTFIIWFVIGTVVYLLLWVLFLVFNAYKSDSVPSRNFFVPRGYSRLGGFFNFIARGSIRTLALGGFMVWGVLFLGIVLPYITMIFASSLVRFDPMSVPTLLETVLVIVFCFYVFIIFARVIFLKRRLFS